MKLFSERLRTQRKLKSKTQNDVAKTLNISRTAYGEYERGNHLPTADKLLTLAVTLEVSIDYLLGREDSKTFDVTETLNYIVQNIKAGNTDFSEQNCVLAACSIENAKSIINLIERSAKK